MYLVNIENGFLFCAEAFHHTFQPLFEVAPILCTGQHTTQIQFVNAASFQAFGYLSGFYAGCQSVSQGCFSHSWFTDVQRVVFVFPAQHFDGTFQFHFSSYQRIVIFQLLVQAGDEILGNTMRLVRIILIQTKVVSINDHQLADEIRNPFLQVFFQEVASPGFRQQ